MHLDNYLSHLPTDGLKTSVREFSEEIYNNVYLHFDFRSNTNGLLFGNVQSGKTAQMLGAIARFADAGYRIFLILTSDNVDLQRQTYNRTKHALTDFDVYSEREEALFLRQSIRKPVVLVLKKNARILSKWRDLLCSSSHCKGRFLMVFDDEGDHASLNTLINQNRSSTINKTLDDIKDSASSSIFFSVTATPQALLLQSSHSGWQPRFVNYFKPGKGYLGGDFFYADPKPYTIVFTPEHELDDVTVDDDNFCPIGLRQSIIHYLIVCAHKSLNGETNCNFMIHPSSRTNIHERFATRIEEHLNLLQNSSSEQAFDDNLREAWNDLQKSKPDLEAFEDIKDKVTELLDDMSIRVYTLNSVSNTGRDPNNPDALNLAKGFNIVVGGNTLGRGITFPHLQIVYYCRNSRTPQADTFWQHSRIFGYDREAELVRIFIPESLYKLFCELNKANSMLIKQIREQGLAGIELIYPNGIRPTRRNVLDNRFLKILMGGVNMFPTHPMENNVEHIDPLVQPYIEEGLQNVQADTIVTILKYAGSLNCEDFDNQKYINCIQALEKKRPKMKFKLLVRTNRNITKGTGTLLSPTDRNLADSIEKDVVLVLYRLNGYKEQGWSGVPLWVPNIKFPNDCCFYDVEP